MKYSLCTFVLCAFLFSACGPVQQVSRVASDTQTDLSGKWNDTDARLVAEEMISGAVSSAWLQNFTEENGEPPVVIVGRVRNETMEHIDTDVITKEMERAFINSGKVQVVASKTERRQIREEREDQQSFSSYESAKNLAQEVGADFMLIGNISSILDESASGKDAAIFYDVNLELIDVETNRKVWIDDKEIKKLIERRKLRG
ncbi:MAG: penicillin-binding protein activator LpoB [Gracilimonas sp.]|jgi:uncharacterized protein (TIGR02722 family)|nr:penicillin-binding protein activator LpoB [Gracilimonas sp.]